MAEVVAAELLLDVALRAPLVVTQTVEPVLQLLLLARQTLFEAADGEPLAILFVAQPVDLAVGHAHIVAGLDMQVAACLLSGAVGDVFKALADPTRRTILDELAQRDGQTLFEICGRLATKHELGSTRQAISQHLAVLEDAGLVGTRREGRYKFHDLNTAPLERIADRWLERRRPEDR